MERTECDCTVLHDEIVEEVRLNMPAEDDLFDLGDFFKIFGDSTRIRILWALLLHEMCVCDIAALLNMTKSAISHQLRILKQTRLIRSRKAGKVVFYSLNDAHIKDILSLGLEHINERR